MRPLARDYRAHQDASRKGNIDGNHVNRYFSLSDYHSVLDPCPPLRIEARSLDDPLALSENRPTHADAWQLLCKWGSNVRERPAVNAGRQLRATGDLIGLGLELFNVPVGPYELAVQELGLGKGDPDHEPSRKVGYVLSLAYDPS